MVAVLYGLVCGCVVSLVASQLLTRLSLAETERREKGSSSLQRGSV